MAKKSTAAGLPVPRIVAMLIEAARSDTVYADLYLRRARSLLESVLPLDQYQVLKRIQRDIDEAVRQSKQATLAQDWPRVATLAKRVDELRGGAQERAALGELGAAVYESSGVGIDPFSPGFEALPGLDQDPTARRATLVERLQTLAEVDAPLADFYASRRTFCAGLALASKRATTATTSGTSAAELEQLAVQAAQRGDMSQLQRCAEELMARRAKEAAAGTAQAAAPTGAVGRATYECPVDLAAPFPDEAAQRAQKLGLAVARTEPMPQAGPLFDYVHTHIWQADLSDVETEREGTIRAEAMVEELGFPAELSGPMKILVGQFLLNAFINSGGARYVPPFRAETALIEDFPEEQEPPATGELLSALGLPHRRALARQQIEAALLERGATVVEEQLRLDPKEFRLVCIPSDLYMRFGRDRGWGRQQRWTHFDGYQVFKNGSLRALVGGDVRYGGLSDVVSIGVADQREGVVVRFAVIRRARQVARWR